MKEEKFYKEIDKIAQKIGQSRAGRTLATKVYQLAKVSYSSCPSSESTQLIIDKNVSTLILSIESAHRHISKRGNKYLRKAGYEVMKSIKSFCKVGNELYDYMLQKESEGKCKKAAKIAILNKFLRQYYGILKKKYIELGTW